MFSFLILFVVGIIGMRVCDPILRERQGKAPIEVDPASTGIPRIISSLAAFGWWICLAITILATIRLLFMIPWVLWFAIIAVIIIGHVVYDHYTGKGVGES